MLQASPKRLSANRPGLVNFLVVWALIWFIALFVSAQLDFQLARAIGVSSLWLIFHTLLATMQLLWIRLHLSVTLRWWVPLAIAGAVVGSFTAELFTAYIDHPVPVWLYRGSSPESQVQAKYALYYVTFNFLLFSIPLIFQWAALRRRFSGHRIWLLAALTYAPMAYGVAEDQGVLLSTLRFLRDSVGIDVRAAAPHLGGLPLCSIG